MTARVVSKLSAVLPSNTILDEKTPADVTSDKLPVVITVPETLGKVIVLSAVGSVTHQVLFQNYLLLHLQKYDTSCRLLIVGELIVGNLLVFYLLMYQLLFYLLVYQ